MRRKLLFEVSLKGCFKLDGYGIVRNKFTRNMGYLLDGLIRLADVSLYDEGGTSRTVRTSTGHLLSWLTTASSVIVGYGISLLPQFGIGSNPPTVTDNNLNSADLFLPTNYVDVIEASDKTQFVIASIWSPDADKSYLEVGLKIITDLYYAYPCLLSRTVLSPALSRVNGTEYYDGYILEFPSNFTRWFIRALCSTVSGNGMRPTRGRVAKDINNSLFVLRVPNVFAGSPDVMIGSDNTPPSPDDYNLKSPIASLSSQAQAVEVDTTLQEVRIVRSGSITPSSNITLGEIGLFCNLAGFSGGSSVTAKTMLVRVALPSPVTLNAGTTYTLGIVLKLT